MQKLFLSLLMMAGVVVAITSCSDQGEDFVDPTAGADYFAMYEEMAMKNLEDMEANRQAFQIVQGPITANATWTNDRIWVLRGPVVVPNGVTLTIEAGTIVKAFPGQAARSSFLVVDTDGQLIADGTEEDPIIFTSLADRIEPGQVIIPAELANFRLPAAARGLWGGILMLGNAPVIAPAGANFVEGIPEGAVSSGPGGTVNVPRQYGGSVMDDNSGTLRYVSIRHGGTVIGDLQQGNEINGLTLGGVGNGTIIEFVEVFANRDDGFEWFGGTVNSKYLIGSFCGDDTFDWDFGYNGKGQYWLAWMDIAGDRGAEQDGSAGDVICTLESVPVIVNATYAGDAEDGTDVMILRDNAAAIYARSLFFDHGTGVQIESIDPAVVPCSSFGRLQDGETAFIENFFNGVNGPQFVRTGFQSGAIDPANFPNQLVNNQAISGLNLTTGVVPTNAELQGLAELSSVVDLMGFFDNTTFVGAVDPATANDPWAAGWTAWSFYFANPGTPGGPPTGQ
ncbi:MAG: hypothetical protein HC880_02160 [Bacteroidia bacterium]|nr:hypothetical protein [Bacteroidia bacterium]